MLRAALRIGTLAALLSALAAPLLAQEKVKVCALTDVAEAMAPVADSYPRLDLVVAQTGDQMVEQAAQCEVVLGVPGGLAADIVRAAPSLRWIQSFSAGVEGLVSIPELRESDIVLTNVKILQGPEIADHAFALLLNFTRDIKFFNEQMKTGFERRSRLPLIELRGKTALIVGLGGIGTQIAQRAAGFGMRVIAVDPKDIPLHRDVAYVGKPDELDQLLPQADVVFSSVPLTAESTGMLGGNQFAVMKDGVYLINVSRGGIVDTGALLEALRSGKVRAAGLDVTEPEPLPTDHPLWALPNVTITPHLATASDQLAGRRNHLFQDNLERYLSGRPLRHVVDKHAGY